MYDSLNLLTVYNAAENIPKAQFLTPCALLGRRLKFAVFHQVEFLAKDFEALL